MDNLRKLRDEKFNHAQHINENPQGPNGDLSAEQLVEFNTDMEAVNNLDAQISRHEMLFKKADEYKAEAKQSNGRLSPVAKIHNEVEKFSFTKAMNDMCEFGRVQGLEAEVSDEIAKAKGKKAQGFYLPTHETYGNLDTTTGAGALNTPVLFNDLISLLRNKMFCVKLGAQVLSGLNGNLSIPRQSGAATAYWTDGAIGSNLTASNQTLDGVPLAQKTLGAKTFYSRAFLRQSGIDVENFIRQDLAAVLAIELDRAVINGSGSSNVPTGILQDSNNTTVALGTNGALANFANIISLETSVANLNADLGSMAYLTNPSQRGKLKGTPKVATYSADMIWQSDNTVNGYPAYASVQVPSNLTKGSASGTCSAIIFGNWSDVIIAQWGEGIDVIVNPYTNDLSVSVTVGADYNVAFRHSTSFAKIVDAL